MFPSKQFRQGSVLVSWLCSKPQLGWLWGGGLRSTKDLLTPMVGPSWLLPGTIAGIVCQNIYMWPLHVPHYMVVGFLEQATLQKEKERELGGSCITFYDWASEASFPLHFIPWIGHKDLPKFKGEEKRNRQVKSFAPHSFQVVTTVCQLKGEEIDSSPQWRNSRVLEHLVLGLLLWPFLKNTVCHV